MTLLRFDIYYENREYARMMGDPLLGVVYAESKNEAETIAIKNGLGGTGGCWAVCRNEKSE
ncbi:hypothetical protein [Anabaena azotica]|uniref:Uncharacterized protein n=1 Tax=Anabaena azotica FACHB-119 TaxID=947527 RepID=A0ABR8CY72_9NOST|nr:hypothetical protein [Anabaena azotica]MBD2499860.1 hypothetical protein [Anabaena azotica FACHB-119]